MWERGWRQSWSVTPGIGSRLDTLQLGAHPGPARRAQERCLPAEPHALLVSCRGDRRRRHQGARSCPGVVLIAQGPAGTISCPADFGIVYHLVFSAGEQTFPPVEVDATG